MSAPRPLWYPSPNALPLEATFRANIGAGVEVEAFTIPAHRPRDLRLYALELGSSHTSTAAATNLRIRAQVEGLHEWRDMRLALHSDPAILPLFYTLPAGATGPVSIVNNGGALNNVCIRLAGFYDDQGALSRYGPECYRPGLRSAPFAVFGEVANPPLNAETVILDFRVPFIGDFVRLYAWSVHGSHLSANGYDAQLFGDGLDTGVMAVPVRNGFGHIVAHWRPCAWFLRPGAQYRFVIIPRANSPFTSVGLVGWHGRV